MKSRQCGTCTKCCEGWLTGEVLGHKFYPGRPCHFVATDKGCSIYAKRPQNPCIQYKCGWLTDENIPEWLKPEISNTIIDYRTINNIRYIRLIEAGKPLPSEVLTWFIQYAIKNNLNAMWQIQGIPNWIGSSEFDLAMQESYPKSNS